MEKLFVCVIVRVWCFYNGQVMKENETTLPPAALFIVRFHSFYALHRAGAYKFLMNDDDKEMLKWLHVFK